MTNSQLMGALPLKPANSQYTDGQWQAIYDSGDDILVSASAGSGKTTVLVQRVIEKIIAGANVDELLIVTYTEAAAKEMKARIQGAIQQGINEAGDLALKRHFIHQLSLIPTAPISTLHAFCLQVIRKYYYLIQIDPIFRLATDETESLLLKEDVWSELREELYEEDQLAFYRLTENFSNDRTDEGLTALVFSLYEFARANPNPEEWLASLAQAYEVKDTMAEAEIYQQLIKPNLLKDVAKMMAQSDEMMALTEGEAIFVKVYPLVASEANFAQTLHSYLVADDLVGLYQYLTTGITFTRYPGLRNIEEAEKEVNEAVKELRNSNKKMLLEWQKGVFSLPPEKMVAVMQESQLMVKQMAEVGAKFGAAFSARKAEKNLVDFNDLEHFTLQILANYTEGKWCGTEASTYYRAKFSEILVDEYQDINQLQENILYWLRRPKKGAGNLFMVGDVKQSIYSFRLADPTLFIDKYHAFAKGEDGRRIILAENFRSRHNVLDFTNLIFQQLMNTSLGQLEYDQPAQLLNGFKGFPEEANYDTEILIFENPKEQEAELTDVTDDFQIDDKTEGELRLVGSKIQQLIAEKFPIYDKRTKKTRPIQYQDIVLLTPTKKNNLVLLDIFKELEIPLHVNDTQNYFQATEIRIMIALLNVIDNPYQDIPLAAVLRSPLVGLKENDLATIRLASKTGSFYEALELYLASQKGAAETPLIAMLEQFSQQLLRWRELARRQPLVQLIWQIYQDTGFLDYVGGMPAGKQRQANLHALYERATSYEAMSFKGLFQFVRFIEKMQAKDKDLAEPTAISQDEDAVRVMTIHAAKGLEFPVVFVLDLSRRFNLMDLKNDYIFDEKLGAGIKFTDQTSRLFYRTLPFLAIKEAKHKKLLAEEMRKLYVALTRAEEKLFLVGSYQDEASAWKKWSASALDLTMVINEDTRLKSASLLDWIGMSLIRHRSAQKYQSEYAVATIKELVEHPANFSISFNGIEELRAKQIKSTAQSAEGVPLEPVQTQMVDTELLAAARKRLDFEYPFAQSTKTTSYQSVSEIKRVFEDPDDAQLLTLDLTSGNPHVVNRFAEESLAEPKFMQKVGEPKATEIGTATHLLLQLLPLNQQPTLASVKELLGELVATGSIEEKVAPKIKLEAILSFYATDFGQQLIANHQNVTREQPFSMLLNAAAIFQDYPQEAADNILIHGIIDGYYESESELILYDFKTDHVQNPQDEAELNRLKNKYQGQLSLYRQALEQVKGRPVTATHLILLGANRLMTLT